MSRVRPSSGPAVSLFPFLAVLLCTMGALLVLLVLFSRAANQSESAEAAVARATHHEELALARDDLAWRLEQVVAIRERTRDELARARMQLAGAEEDMRRFEDELAELERVADALGSESDADDTGTDLATLEARLAASRRAAEEADEVRRRRRPAYAVLPYEGDNGTRRRPLYIECCIDGVFLQPEGVRLGPADFEGPPGPGNPLASALRAAREYIARSDAADGEPERQPYPLLLVRPSGVMAYYAAREAIQSWGSEFGYQFVDEEWELAYPPSDPGLAEVERRAVEESRQRLAWLAQVRPERNARPTQQYRAATTRGGIVAEGGPSVLGDRSRFTWGGDGDLQAAGRGGGAAGGAAGGEQAGGGFGGDAGGVPGGAPGGAPGGDPGAVGGSPAGGDDRYLGPSRFYAGGGSGGGPGSGIPAGAAGGTDASGAMVGQAADGQAGGGVPGGVVSAGGPSGNSTRGDGDGTGTAATSAAGAAAHGSAAGGSSSSAGGSGASAGGGGGQRGQAGGGPTLPGLAQSGAQQAGGAAASISGSLAGSRGSNWASLATHDHPVPLTRPIRLECAGDEFRILDASGRVESRVPIGTQTADAVDPLVRSIHAKVAGWGLAGDRMYWRPELVLSATPDGGGRQADLERLLADSGLDTRRAGPLPVRSLPPVHRTGSLPASVRSP